MKGRPIDQLVFDYMFPKPKPNEPTNFHGFLQKHLVNEVRAETTAFYGSLDSRESQYPGLDYSYQPHRVRLSRFTWHRRLFRAFDALGLTKSEIAGLTKWEGTIWAKERFEKEQGFKIRDTTGDCISNWVPPHLREPTIPSAMAAEVEQMDEVEEEDSDEDGEDSDMEIDHSVGVELNRRMLVAAAQRDSGNMDAVLDEEFEEWLKQTAEGFDTPLASGSDATSTSSLPARWLNAARLGQWQQFPETIREIVRTELANSPLAAQPARRAVPRQVRRTAILPGTVNADIDTIFSQR